MFEDYFRGNERHADLVSHLTGSAFLKSEKHRAHVMKHAELNHTTPPANPAAFVGRSTRDILDEEQCERDYARRKQAIEKHPLRGKAPKGSFAKLKDLLRAIASSTMAKAVGIEHGQSFEERYGSGFTHTHAVEPVRAVIAPVRAKPKETYAKTFSKTVALMKSMGLEVSYNSDSGTLTGADAIRRQSLAGAKPAKPKARPLGPDELLQAASTLLHHGRIDAKTAARVQTEVGLRGTVSPDLMKALQEACK